MSMFCRRIDLLAEKEFCERNLRLDFLPKTWSLAAEAFRDISDVLLLSLITIQDVKLNSKETLITQNLEHELKPKAKPKIDLSVKVDFLTCIFRFCHLFQSSVVFSTVKWHKFYKKTSYKLLTSDFNFLKPQKKKSALRGKQNFCSRQ